MTKLERLEAALVKADAAGNADDARALAAEVRRLRAEQASGMPSERRQPEDRFVGVGREVGPAMAMLDEEGKRQALETGALGALGIAVGPVFAAATRGVGTAIPALQRFTQPLAASFESAGLRTGLSPQTPAVVSGTTRAVGAALPAGTAAEIAEPGSFEEGAALGLATPVVIKAASKVMAPKGPTTRAVQKASQEKYGEVEKANVRIKPTAFNALALRLQKVADDLEFIPESHMGVQSALNSFANQASKNEMVNLTKLDKLRRVVARKAAARGGEQGRIGAAMVTEIDSFINNTVPKAVVQQLETARDLWAKMTRSKVIENTLSAALRSEREPATAIPKKFKELAESPSKQSTFRSFSPEEQELIKKIGDGSITMNMLQAPSAFAPPRMRDVLSEKALLPSALLTATGAAASPGAAMLAAMTGYGSRQFANRLAQTQAERLALQVRMGRAPQQYVFEPQIFPQVLPAYAVNE